MENCWFKIGYQKIELPKSPVSNPTSDVQAVFDSSSSSPEEKTKETELKVKPSVFNAFDLISLSSGFDLSGLFEEDNCRRQQAKLDSPPQSRPQRLCRNWKK
ncbi:hypothetical protein K1719_015379 [Acacia pycnantha]|nr:hypothetical protein K1719_015379 [Acacia pycnantha]